MNCGLKYCRNVGNAKVPSRELAKYKHNQSPLQYLRTNRNFVCQLAMKTRKHQNACAREQH